MVTGDSADGNPVRVVKAQQRGALCIDYVSPITLRYRHCEGGEYTDEPVSLLEVPTAPLSVLLRAAHKPALVKVGETINGGSHSSQLGDTDDDEDLIPELGDSNGEPHTMSPFLLQDVYARENNITWTKV